MKDTIRKIIDAGNQAPSGGNSQPWKFRVHDNIIEVTMLPEKDHPVLNFRNRGTCLALGALLENMEIAANYAGYEVEVDLFPSALRANFSLTASSASDPDELFDAITKRHSNRKSYQKDPLTGKEIDYIFQDACKFPDCQLVHIQKEKFRSVAQSLAIDISMFLQNKLLHKLFFKEIIWKEEDQKTRGGLFIRTMEAVPPKSMIFKLLQYWSVAQFFSKIGLPKKISEESVEKVVSSGSLAVILVPNDDLSFVYAGRLLENIWLRASKLNLGFQLITGSLFLWQRLQFGEDEIFSEEEKKIINDAYENLTKEIGVTDKIVALAFRIGKADSPLAVSYKRPPSIDWE